MLFLNMSVYFYFLIIQCLKKKWEIIFSSNLIIMKIMSDAIQPGENKFYK